MVKYLIDGKLVITHNKIRGLSNFGRHGVMVFDKTLIFFIVYLG